MTGLLALWLPILLSAVIVFVASSIIHMFLPWHRSDYGMVPNQDKVMDALRPFNIPPGDYMLPRPANLADMRNPEFIAKLDRGPKIVMTVMPNGHQGMGGTFVKWFLYAVVVNVFAAYVAGRALPPGTDYLHVFRFAGVTAFVGYSLALWPLSIWFQRSWMITIKATFDGLIYGLLTAGVFGWLWPR